MRMIIKCNNSHTHTPSKGLSGKVLSTSTVLDEICRYLARDHFASVVHIMPSLW